MFIHQILHLESNMNHIFKTAVTVALFSCITNTNAADAKQYATFKTSLGDFTCELYPEKAAKTVENFVGLATGSKIWKHPGTGKTMEKQPLYDNTVFHRTISGFMIQGGDPLGLGIGGPGYKFEDETNDFTFAEKGMLAMANSGPNTNGSQFFVTVAPTPHLNGRHTIFGKVVKGYDIVEKIANRPSGPNGQVSDPVKLQKVIITDSLNATDSATSKTDSQTSGTK